MHEKKEALPLDTKIYHGNQHYKKGKKPLVID
jgi:hypothetical protein